jgi:hypothetical protein
MATVWTHALRSVETGREAEFVPAWHELARVGTAKLHGTGPPTLQRDRGWTNEFISFGPWPSLDDVDCFRSSRPCRDAQERLREVLDGFVTRTLDEIQVGG